MPLYTYKCEVCGLVRDIVTSMGARDEPVPCKHFGGPVSLIQNCQGNMVRQPSAPAFKIVGASYRNGYQGDK